MSARVGWAGCDRVHVSYSVKKKAFPKLMGNALCVSHMNTRLTESKTTIENHSQVRTLVGKLRRFYLWS